MPLQAMPVGLQFGIPPHSIFKYFAA